MVFYFSLERQLVLEPKHWFHKLAVKRKDVYRRLALDGLGSSNLISEHTIVRAHDRAQPLLMKMFMSSNYGKRSFNPTDTKVILLRIKTGIRCIWRCYYRQFPVQRLIRQ
jgi:hypothetical protein